MLTKFICLANSYKEGGRCIAGIELDANNRPVFINSRPKWIRPVCNTLHGEIPKDIALPFQVLNIIQLDVTVSQPQGYQSENIAFNENAIKVIGSFDSYQLNDLCDDWRYVFGNKGKAVSKEAIANLKNSLMLVSANEFEVTQRTYNDRPDKRQIRLIFTYNGSQYDFPITDPVFLQIYQNNPDVLKNVDKIYLTLSLGIEWENWYYKLVAAIIY